MTEELDIPDVNGICRLCLKDDCTIIPIFGRENTSRNGIPLSKKILDCVSVKVSDGDGLPGMICVGCVHQVDSWQGFKNSCDVSQKKLNSWLRKTNPEIYAKNEAEKVKKTRAVAETSDVIDLSSDDEDIVVSRQPVLRRSITNKSYKNQTISRFQNPEFLIKTNEVEILPVQNVCINEKNNHAELEDIPSPDLDSPDGLTEVADAAEEAFEHDSSQDHIWPDAETTDPLGNVEPMAEENGSENPEITKDSTPKDQINNYSQDEHSNQTIIPQCDKLNEAANTGEAETAEVTEPCVNGTVENSSSGNVENNSDAGETSTDLIDNSNRVEGQNQDTAKLDGKTASEDTEDVSRPQPEDKINDGDDPDPLDKTQPSAEADNINASATPDDCSDNHENTTVENNLHSAENLEQNENSVENSSSFVIERVTSLNNENDERMEVDTNSRDLAEENSERENSNDHWESQCQEDDSQDAEPDIILCDSITSVVTHIKEEPLSADEAEAEEDGEDPLNFHSVLLKRESEDFVDESEDIKPNVELLNQALENQYTPKRLKNGKLHCEPCRVSFPNDVYYERHAHSLRHKMNFKLYRMGKAPTRARGKALINITMGNISNYPRGSGPYCCDQCPSRFKHMRNLHTHKKKHLMEVRVSSRKPPSDTASQSSDFEITNVEPKAKEDLKCELCFQSFMSVPALVSHKRFCGLSEKQQCTHCGQSFTTQSLFVKHRKDCLKDYRRSLFSEQRLREEEMNSRMTPPPQQTPPKPSTPVPVPVPVTVTLDGSVLACTLCNLTFQTSTDLINHMQQNHMDFGKVKHNPPPELPDFAKPNHFSRTRDSSLHYCKYCLRSFPTLGALSSHTGYHARKSAYCCKFCRQTFKDKISFRQHIRVHISDPTLNRNVCWMCYTPFASQKDLINHKAVHANVKLKVYSCSICGNSYNSKELLSKHKRSTHMMPLINPEDDLEMVQDNESAYHQMIDEDNKLFKCRICKKRFTTSGNLKRHSLKHKPGFAGNVTNFHTDYSVQHRCNGCFKSFKTPTGLLNHKPFCTRIRKTGLPHVNNVHGAIKCKDCKRWFASQNSIYKHRVLKRCRPIQQHIEEEPIVPIRAQNCPNCDQQFLSEESLTRHKQNCKPSIERLTCDCGEVFGSVELKQSHAETCASNCTCKNCSMKFNSPEELESHQSICQIQAQNHIPIPSFQPKVASYTPESRLPSVECAKCKKKFVYSKCLQIHEDKCLYDRWPCTNCLEIFPTESALATHKSHKSCQSPRHSRSSSVTSMSDGPTFKCDSCPERFLSANELREHTAICENRLSGIEPEGGSGERPFKCDQCDKTFLWKVNVQRHRKLAHKHLYQSDTESTPIRKNPEREASTFRCKLCPDIVFHKQQGLLEHQRIHENQEEEKEIAEDDTNESGVLLTCELCDKKLPEALYPLHMDEHMNDDFEESQEIEPPPVECELGGSYPCDICGKEFSTPQSRKSHRASHWRHYTTGYVPTLEPSIKRKYKARHVRCNICNKLLSINSLPKHKMMHRREAADFYGGENSSQTPQKPSQSGNVSRSSTPNLMMDLSSNQEEENEETSTSIFPCPKCDKTFKLRKLLLEHLKNHMDESSDSSDYSSAAGSVDQYPYKCVYCDLSWKYKSVYERHLSSKKHLETHKQLSGII